MDIKIASLFRFSASMLSRREDQRLRRFMHIPFIVREIKIGNLLNFISGITYIKILSEEIPEVLPKIKVDIKKVSLNELLGSNLTNLEEFFPSLKEGKMNAASDETEYFIATRKDRELVYITSVGPTSRGRIMIGGTKTLERYRGNCINPAVLVCLMRYMRDKKGVDKIYVSTAGTNMNMQKGVILAGFRPDRIFYKLFVFERPVRPLLFLRALFKSP